MFGLDCYCVSFLDIVVLSEWFWNGYSEGVPVFAGSYFELYFSVVFVSDWYHRLFVFDLIDSVVTL